MTSNTTCCVRCNAEFVPFCSSGAANDCACDVQGSFILGGYGSTEIDIENSPFAFTAGKDHGFAEGKICDQCIRDLIEAGEICQYVS
jgi:predicted Rdx family selenoprotein